ncbi:class I SAM-dependent methyltransferase [Rhodoplanes serenus]|uniref:class I SAM-dependent methyltransferase n=1 Tax=Rhodoplanes serenus TaxID=200615 RepID=UPI001FDF3075|nr:SAM-dependent methyltransferase [Rhodoplanes serenus]
MSPLADLLRRRIATAGPLPVADYMSLCLGHPEHGYYATRDPFGAAGDFTTAPEISQMFGELLGLWAAAVWQQMGEPSSLRLIELGPGRGTLMADALRAARVLPAFRTALSVHLVETSPLLAGRQRDTLAGAGVPLAWHDDLGAVLPGPAIVLANEFVDALPIRQAVRTATGWRERVVTLAPNGRLAFDLAAPDPALAAAVPAALRTSPPDMIVEWRDEAFVGRLAARVAGDRESPGAALIIDYGHTISGAGDTLQAVRGHAFADPLAAPGEADLTAHVDFAALARAAAAAGARVHGPLTQAEFLRRLGIDARAAQLKASAPAEAAAIDAAVARLLDSGRTGMGALFKVLAVADPALGPLPALD